MTGEATEHVGAPASVDDLDTLLEFVKAERGFDFTGYKRGTLERRVAKRMQASGVDSYVAYADYLAAHPDEFIELFNTILINVTTFFRDPPAWEYLGAEIIPRLLQQRDDTAPIRIWSAGCATGEEAFSLAIMLCEAMGDDAFRDRVKIYATDLDDDALAVGRQAVYANKQLSELSDELRAKYFEETNGSRSTIRTDLRRSVIFGKHDLIQDPPISRIDLLAARNTLMYFGPDAQARVLSHFHFALNPNGYLFLGRSEMLLTRSRLFVPVELKRRVFAKVPLTSIRERLHELVQAGDGAIPQRVPEDTLLRHATLESAPVAQIVVDRSGVLALANAQARKLFGLLPADIGRPLQDLELSYRPVELRSQIDAVYAQHHPSMVREVEWAIGGELRWFDVQVSTLIGTDGATIGAGITFSDITRFRMLRESVERSKESLETAYEELQSTAEELETTNEELQSTNEELETTNEEIQSTNEELETMNEELQSTNEELETINDELHQRTDDLNQINAFLESILGSLRHAVVVLDRELRVQAWNEHASDMWGLRSEEVEGEHFLNLDIGLPVEHIAVMLRACLGSHGEDNLELDATDRRGRTIRCVVTCSPLLGAGDEIRGVIVQMEERETSEA
jgi:two-component system, chemotaxis family, CheB/CheR fusion protein